MTIQTTQVGGERSSLLQMLESRTDAEVAALDTDRIAFDLGHMPHPDAGNVGDPIERARREEPEVEGEDCGSSRPGGKR